MPYGFGLIVLSALFIGYRLSEYDYYSAEEGIGYMLGIIGGTMMLALLLYPLRKRIKFLRVIGSVKVWFGFHMVLGILGPLLILFHANFRLGSTNSNVALFSMLIVSGSGVIGRYIYTKIHHGLYGQKIELAELTGRLQNNQETLSSLLKLNPKAREELFEFATHVMTPPNGLIHSCMRIMSVGMRSRLLVRKLKKSTLEKLNSVSAELNLTKEEKKKTVKVIVREADRFLNRARKVVEFSFYERMFALWHVLHLPLFFMLVIAAIVHVIAVHWY